ncbi:MAG: shikimate kinase [Planctomycetota bacterium]
MERQRLLQDLGRRLRAARERRGLSVSALAAAAGVSRRHLTEAEAGRANFGVALLFELARALGVRAAELIDVEVASRERVALVGLRGAGKSTVGRALALALEVPFVELDQRVEERAGLRLGEIFDLHGAAYFHQLEGEALEQVLSEGERVVLAAGGSIVASESNFARLRDACRTVWLKASAADHMQRVLAQGDRRPMRERPRAMEELEALLAKREASYAQCEITIDTSERSVEDIERAVRAALAPEQ